MTQQSSLLSRDQILATKDISYDVVSVPLWGGDVKLKQLSASQQFDLSNLLDLPENKGLGMYLILTIMAVDEHDAPIFTKDDVAALKDKNFHVLNMLQRRAVDLNNAGAAAKIAAKND